MTATNEDNEGNIFFWNEETHQWEYLDGDICIDGKKKRIWHKCNKPHIDVNEIENVDFYLQGLTNCSFITNACCGHGNDDLAYITLADGRRFVLDKYEIDDELI